MIDTTLTQIGAGDANLQKTYGSHIANASNDQNGSVSSDNNTLIHKLKESMLKNAEAGVILYQNGENVDSWVDIHNAAAISTYQERKALPSESNDPSQYFSTYSSETQSIADAVQSALSKNNIQISSSDAFSIQFDQNLNFTVSGANTTASKVIQDTINSQASYRYTLANSLYYQVTFDGQYLPYTSPTTPFEYQAKQLGSYIHYNVSTRFSGNPYDLQEPPFPKFSTAPIAYSINGFSANTDTPENTVSGTVLNTTA